MTTERREFKRLNVSVPCLLRWRDTRLPGEVANISFGGALVTDLDSPPPNDSIVVLACLDTTGRQVMLLNSLISRVVRSSSDINEDEKAGWIAVKFEEPHDNVRLELQSLSVTENL